MICVRERKGAIIVTVLNGEKDVLKINGNQEFILKNELRIAATLLNGLGSAEKDYAHAMESIMKMPYYFVLVSGRRMIEFTVDLEKELSGLTKMPSDKFLDELLRKIFGDFEVIEE